MPYVKSISIHSTPEKSIAYIVNKDKTDDLLYVSGLNCSTVPDIAHMEMKTVFETYSSHSFDEKQSVNSKTPVKLFHFVHSFRPTDEITPELAHQTAQEWAEKAFGKDRQIIVSTHVDKSHIHSHIIINPYDLNGKKFNSNKKTLEAVRELSNTIALRYGIQPIPKKNQKKSVSYKEWSERKKGTSWKQNIREAVDRLVYETENFDSLLKQLEKQGYVIRRGKYISVRPPDRERAVRLTAKSLGEGYAPENIENRITLAKEQKKLQERQKAVQTYENMNSMEKLYTRRIYEVSQLVRNGEKIARKYNSKLPYSVENDFEVYHLAMQLQIIKRDSISSVSQLEYMLSEVGKEHENARQELNKLAEKQQQFKMIIDNADQYFYLKSIPAFQLTQAEKLKLQMSENIVQKCGIETLEDVQKVRQLYDETTKQSTVLNQSFGVLEKRYREYADILHRYKTVSRSDYISQLIEEKRRKKNNLE